MLMEGVVRGSSATDQFDLPESGYAAAKAA